LRFCYEDGAGLSNVEAIMAGAYGACRLGKYALEQVRILKDAGIDIPIRTTVSNDAYRDVDLGPGFLRLVWKGCVAVDCLQRLLWRTRPYEKQKGAADQLFSECLGRIKERIRGKGNYDDVLREATGEFKALIDPNMHRKPLVGINGEIFLRSNRFSNQGLVRECENAGLEVVVSPMGEWIKYISHRHLEDAISDRKLIKSLVSYVLKRVQEHDENVTARYFEGLIDEREPSTSHLLAQTERWLSPKCGSEAVLSIGSGIDCMENPEFAGVISVMPHGCMPGGIVAAMSERFSTLYRKPWINLTYDGFVESTNLTKISNFAEVIRFCSQEGRRGA